MSIYKQSLSSPIKGTVRRTKRKNEDLSDYEGSMKDRNNTVGSGYQGENILNERELVRMETLNVSEIEFSSPVRTHDNIEKAKSSGLPINRDEQSKATFISLNNNFDDDLSSDQPKYAKTGVMTRRINDDKTEEKSGEIAGEGRKIVRKKNNLVTANEDENEEMSRAKVSRNEQHDQNIQKPLISIPFDSNENGQLVDRKGRTVDDRGRFIDEEGRLIDKKGRLIDTLGRTIDPDCVNMLGQTVDAEGRTIDFKGNVINQDGSVEQLNIRFDKKGRLVNDSLEFVDSFGRVIDNNRKDQNGNKIDAQGRIIDSRGYVIDQSGRPISKMMPFSSVPLSKSAVKREQDNNQQNKELSSLAFKTHVVRTDKIIKSNSKISITEENEHCQNLRSNNCPECMSRDRSVNRTIDRGLQVETDNTVQEIRIRQTAEGINIIIPTNPRVDYKGSRNESKYSISKTEVEIPTKNIKKFSTLGDLSGNSTVMASNITQSRTPKERLSRDERYTSVFDGDFGDFKLNGHTQKKSSFFGLDTFSGSKANWQDYSYSSNAKKLNAMKVELYPKFERGKSKPKKTYRDLIYPKNEI